MQATYITHSGDDLLVVNAARASFDREKQEFDESDARLIRFLAREGHWTPFAHPSITIRERIPIAIARQRMRHSIGFNYSEMSMRYVSDPGKAEVFSPKLWRMKPDNAKSGSGGVFADQSAVQHTYNRAARSAVYAYHELIEMGVAPEQARFALPVGTYTTIIVTGSLAAWARAYKLRSAPDAQGESRDLAQMWDEIIAPLYPVAWQALTSAGVNP
jgi:thymidylate synthase (FAD)